MIKQKSKRSFIQNTKLFCLLSSALFLYGCQKDDNPQASAPQGMPEINVTVQTIQPQNILMQKELPGRAKAYRIAEVRPQVGGIILTQNFNEGSFVKEGETLYQIDPALYNATLGQAKAALEKAKANQFAAQAKADRINALSDSKAVSKQDIDDANSLLHQANADVLAAEANVKTAEINLNYTRMLAPISGQIGKSNFTQGALVAAGQSLEMATIQQINPMRVDLTYSVNEFTEMQQKIRNGTLTNHIEGKSDADNFSVRLIMDDGSEYPHKGRVKFSDRTVDSTTGSILIQAEFPNPEQMILPGMFVRAIVEQGVQKDTITIPQRAIFRDPTGRAMVVVITPKNTAEIRPVEIDQSFGNEWIISKGLNAGDRIVVAGIQQVNSALRGSKVVKVKATEIADQKSASTAPNTNK